jgi:hypothetical protein
MTSLPSVDKAQPAHNARPVKTIAISIDKRALSATNALIAPIGGLIEFFD